MNNGRTRFVLTAGTTQTASIDGISAAGADSEAMDHTPAADAEILTYGTTVRSPVVPQSPTGCLTPAVVTRAVRDLVGFELGVVDGGLAEPTGAPTVTVGAQPGDDIREQDPVSSAPGAFEAARQYGRALPDDELFLAESIPGGTTTAMGVLRALGERNAVSSSLPENPIETKREVVADALEASSLSAGDASGDPKRALRRMADPVLTVVSGLALGAIEGETAVTLAGGTQMVAVAAVLRHSDVEQRLPLATTSYVAEDETAGIDAAAEDLRLDVEVTDPGFGMSDHPAMETYAAGEVKEGVGMGGALALASRAGISMAAVRDRVGTIADELVKD